MHVEMSRRVLWLGLAALALGAGGCGQRQYDVTGKVTYNGATLDKPNGVVVFVGPAGEQVVATIESDGTYHASKVSGGVNRLAAYWPNPKATQGKKGKLRPGEIPPPSPPLFLTPEKYSSPDTSGLSVTVEKEMVFDVELVGPPIK